MQKQRLQSVSDRYLDAVVTSSDDDPAVTKRNIRALVNEEARRIGANSPASIRYSRLDNDTMGYVHIAKDGKKTINLDITWSYAHKWENSPEEKANTLSHEITHLKYRHHDENFWRTLLTLNPDYHPADSLDIPEVAKEWKALRLAKKKMYS